ncbi:MAG: hypothetical protein F6K50_20235 [Moorea sp. SIO3I7]|uniref:KOW motif-containing protein n=1 Tax=Moorena sp. SIO3I6 TaxID=2607831 RepID=UPI0013C571BF|nr:KOW motif-containing protein [Moorena sp. SIO3I6]NEN97764.1 hypothetical protein [Moorena sp. SIO3I7]NEP24301.1 hypothetical protein [Moorena sp. SIO3I6]
MVSQLEIFFVTGDEVKILDGRYKGQTGVVANEKPSTPYQKARICVDMSRGIKWFKREQLEKIISVNEETKSSEQVESPVNDKTESSESAELEVNSVAQSDVTYQWLDPKSIELEDGTQSRTTTDEKAIARYCLEMEENRWDWRHDPPVIFDDGKTKRPGDGHHRIKAAAQVEQQIFCEVRIGTLIDAIRYSCSSNQRPSLHRTNADKRRAVEMMFQTLIEEFGSLDAIPRSQGGKRKGLDWTNRRIAEHVGVGRSLVNDIRAELELTDRICQFTEGDRVEVIKDKNLPDWTSPGELGTVSSKDKKLGLLVSWDNDIPRHIHPDKVQKTHLPKPSPTPVPKSIESEPAQVPTSVPKSNQPAKVHTPVPKSIESEPAQVPTPVAKSNEPAQVPTPVAKGIESEPAQAPTPPPLVKQEVEQVVAPAEFKDKDSQIPPELPHNPAPVLDEKDSQVSPDVPPELPHNPASEDIDESEEFFTIKLLPESMKDITTVVVNNAEHFSHEQVQMILKALVTKHGIGEIDEILNKLEQQQVG